VKSWVDAAETDIEVSVSNIVEIPSELVQLNSGYGLTLNGISVVSLATNTQSSFSSIDDLVSSINAVTDESGVFASRNQLGDLQIQNRDLGGENIVLGGTSGLPGNVLGIGSKTYIGNLELELTSSSEEAIVFELGDDGKPSDLNLLGLNTQVRLSGDIDEDLVVFLTGDGQSSLEAFASGSEANVIDQLRGRQLEFYFDSENSYQIRDLVTDTVLANRTYQGELALDYQGIDINLDNRAVIGDRFVVDGNNLGPNGSFDGQGNNSNILRFVDLESKGVLSGGETISEGYLKFVGDVGNVTTQSEIARDALSIVQQQAIEARDRVSGVSLDKEAADLIRFQQAYQASAQVMQVATKLFDTVLQVT
jgi:flagellar hook-associated protein FlgK